LPAIKARAIRQVESARVDSFYIDVRSLFQLWHSGMSWPGLVDGALVPEQPALGLPHFSDSLPRQWEPARQAVNWPGLPASDVLF